MKMYQFLKRQHHKEFMNDIQSQFVKNILGAAETNPKDDGVAFAPSNIALCKYWGKRDAALNLPVNSSLSISLGDLGSRTEIRPAQANAVYLNGRLQPSSSGFASRIVDFLGLFPEFDGMHFEVRTENNIPTAAGLASSASGFAALVLALNDWAGWGLERQQLSMLARLGSGSASRSVYSGFVQWHAGSRPDGTDSFAERLPFEWPELRVGVVELTDAEKPVGSRDGMNRTVETSTLYRSWPKQASADLETIRAAIEGRHFSMLGRAAECNALSMHATMMAAWPPLIYLQPATLGQIHKVQRLRADGLEIYLTIDAGPNLKLLFLEEIEQDVSTFFPDMQTIIPFS
jgi:diphosphomevalonate decarboxylase